MTVNHLAGLALLVALALPWLSPFAALPQPAVHNQLLALALLPLGLICFGARWPVPIRQLNLLLAAFAILAVTALAQPAGLNEGLVLLVAALLAWQGFALGFRLADGLWGGLLVAALLNALIALLQLLAPNWIVAPWLLGSTLPGRAVGHLLQPNLLASVLLLGLLALAALAARRGWRWPLTLPALALLIFGLAATGSRGAWLLGLPLIWLWAVREPGLPPALRRLLLALPLFGLLAFVLLQLVLPGEGLALGRRLVVEGASGGARGPIWRQTLELIASHPFGVGVGEFMRAWMLTPFGGRSGHVFDHSHNLILQILVERGWLLGGAALTLLLAALWTTLRLVWRDTGDFGLQRRAAAIALLVMAAHSMVEYPLWYAHLLLPTALLWGFALAPNSGEVQARPLPWLRVWALLPIAGALWAGHEYASLEAVHRPDQNETVRREHLLAAQRSLFFSAPGSYAMAVAVKGDPRVVVLAAEQAAQVFIDPRLLLAWAQALQDQGDGERARYLVARLREFPNSREAHAVASLCQQRPMAWPCQPPRPGLSWRDFQPRPAASQP